jgi:hypothetical protein
MDSTSPTQVPAAIDPLPWLALGELAAAKLPNATHFFNRGLALLVAHLGADRAALTRVESQGLETCWWALGPKVGEADAIHEAEEFFGPRVLDAQDRSLAIPDLLEDAALASHPSARRLGIRAYLGLPLFRQGICTGILSLQYLEPHTFTSVERAYAGILAQLFARTLECEALREDLHATRNVLDLTAAVVEDHALESPVTRLPNRRYLEIWLKAHLYLAVRRGEAMSVATWRIVPDPGTRENLHAIASALRGEDLLVDLDGEVALLLLPHTPVEGAQVLLDRIREVLGPVPMGATLWQPLHPVDREDLVLQQAFLRASAARDHSEATASGDRAEVQWMLLEMEP